jgi:tetratricopeptide (TPR) repeat protein
MKSEKRPTPRIPAAAANEKAAAQAEAATEPIAEPRLGRVEAPSGMKLRTVVLNVGKTFGRLVNWYASLTEVDREDMADRYRRQAIAEFEMQHYAEAADSFSALLKLNLKDAWACQMLGRSLGKAGDVSGAITWLRAAIEKAPQEPESHFQLGVFLSHTEQFQEAEAEFLKVIELVPDESKGHYRLGVVYDQMGEYDKALASLQRALQLRPQSPKINQRLGFVCEGKGDHAGALKYFKKAAELEN